MSARIKQCGPPHHWDQFLGFILKEDFVEKTQRSKGLCNLSPWPILGKGCPRGLGGKGLWEPAQALVQDSHSRGYKAKGGRSYGESVLGPPWAPCSSHICVYSHAPGWPGLPDVAYGVPSSLWLNGSSRCGSSSTKQEGERKGPALISPQAMSLRMTVEIGP